MQKFRLLLLSSFLLMSVCASARTWHISKSGSDLNEGTEAKPFLTISKGARVALAGDTVLIHGGVYREWVSPENSGFSKYRCITYLAAPNENVELKGSEVVKNWKHVSGGLWTVDLSNKMFGPFNPYDIHIFGDWLHNGKDLHLGEVYIDGVPLSEVKKESELSKGEGHWYALAKDTNTIIKCDFGKKNPNKALVEINVRPTCFFPRTTGINYITVKGLHISQAATQWAAPTNDQIGIIGPNWSKGWIIEDCEISYSKCVGVCLGKSRASGHNINSLYGKRHGYNKHGFNREIESVMTALRLGWNKDQVGSHIVRNNKIHDCGQGGIVGHMGCAFSLISHNEIYNINRTNNKITGFETAGIKFHAAIDTRIDHNIIDNTIRGIWLDWQAQGTQVSNNIISRSEEEDLFIEVSHGPTMVYNNIFLSPLAANVTAQGIAFFHNLFKGRVRAFSSQFRYTPYHEPHSTAVKGFFNNTGGDLRFYQNIFLGDAPTEGRGKNGLVDFDKFPVYSDSICESVHRTPDMLKFSFPVWTARNLYFNLAKPFKGEVDGYINPDLNPKVKLEKKKNGYYLKFNLSKDILDKVSTRVINTDMLGITFISEAEFENVDGTPFILKKDIFDNLRSENNPEPGPFETYNDNKEFCIWK